MAEQVRRHRNSNATRLLLIEKFHAGSSGTVEAHPGDQGASESREIQPSMNRSARQDTRNKDDLVGQAEKELADLWAYLKQFRPDGKKK
jgi:hypothetical protein